MKRILIVEDDRDHAESLAEVLEMRGHLVSLANSGEEAIAAFQTSDFALVLMDVRLPGMNGVETFFEFKKRRPDVQVLMMTGYSVEQLVAQAVGNGALGVLRKPFSAAALIAAVETVKPRGIVLVADHDARFSGTIVDLLSANGYRVETAATGAEALAKLSVGAFDCLLLDIRLPVLSGLGVYMQMKDAGLLVPTILVAQGTGDEEARRLCAMSQGLVVKPFDPEALLRTVSRVNPVSA